MITINPKAATKEIIDPMEETIFHEINASGQSEYRRGIPFNPKKCWGKKVRFTPINIVIKWIFNHWGLREIPVNNGNQ